MENDYDILDVLERQRILPGDDLQRLIEFWNEDPSRKETVTAMLLREGVLSPQYTSTLSLLRNGMLKSVQPRQLLTSRGKQRFQQLVDELTRPAAPTPLVQPVAPQVAIIAEADVAAEPSSIDGPEPTMERPSPSTIAPSNKAKTTRLAIPRMESATRPSLGTTTMTSPRANQPQARSGGGMPRVGDTLGKCLLTSELARGASAIVFEALHTSLHVPVAIKVFMPAGKSADDRLRKQFRDEALLLARLNHPNMVRILDFEECDYPYLVLEFVNGFSLNELINNSGHVATPQAASAILRTAEALAYAHAQKVVHRDVKPANIMVDREGIVKLADLGISRITNAIVDHGPTGGQSNRLCGTPAYVAPEQAFAPDSVDGRADIYSLGATWYHATTGMLPFEAKTSQDMILKHVSAKPVAPHLIRSDVPEQISAMILRMMAKKPQDRYASMNDVVDEIRILMSELPMLNPSASTATRSAAIKRSTGSITVILQRSLSKMLGKSKS